MNVFIVWNKENEILGIYRDKREAIKECKKHCSEYAQYNIIDCSDNGCINDRNYDFEHLFCSKIVVNKNAKVVYFIYVYEDQESDGIGESWFIANGSRRKLIDEAKEFYEREHKEDCSECPDCFKNMLNSLKTDNHAEISARRGYIIFNISSFEIS